MRSAAHAPADDRELIWLIRILLLFESSLYAAVAPVLPHYAHALHASKPAIGVLAAAYSAGLIPGAPLGGWLAARLGVRRTAIVGLIGFGLAVAAFGFATDLVALDALRALQGVFCGLIWCGGLTWAIRAVPVASRGRTLGTVIGAATVGTIAGPIIGTFAVAVGTRPAFSLIGAVALALAALTARRPEPAAGDDPAAPAAPGARAQLAAAWRSRGLALGAWLVLLEALTFGAENALLPLRLSRFGASGFGIGATFVVGSALGATLSPTVGRLTDRHGPHLPVAVGLTLGAPLLLVLFAVHTAVPLAALMVIAFGGPATASITPAVAILTASAEAIGVTLVLATTIYNLAYAAGETVGAPLSAGLASVSTDLVPFALIAALMLVTVAPVLAQRRHDRSAESLHGVAGAGPAPGAEELRRAPR